MAVPCRPSFAPGLTNRYLRPGDQPTLALPSPSGTPPPFRHPHWPLPLPGRDLARNCWVQPKCPANSACVTPLRLIRSPIRPSPPRSSPTPASSIAPGAGSRRLPFSSKWRSEPPMVIFRPVDPQADIFDLLDPPVALGHLGEPAGSLSPWRRTASRLWWLRQVHRGRTRVTHNRPLVEAPIVVGKEAEQRKAAGVQGR